MRKELTGRRDLGFSQWHRTAFGPEAAAFDVDLVALCGVCGEPLVVFEATQSSVKATRYLERVASRLGVPAVLVQYENDEHGTLSSLVAIECGGDRIGDADALVEYELHARDVHHASAHPQLPTFTYRQR